MNPERLDALRRLVDDGLIEVTDGTGETVELDPGELTEMLEAVERRRVDALTLALAQAAREYVATQRCFSDDEFKQADVRRAVKAHKALYAAVDVDRAHRERTDR